MAARSRDDADEMNIAANGRIEPDARMRTNRYIADYLGAVLDKHSVIELGSLVFKWTNHKASPELNVYYTRPISSTAGVGAT